MSIQHVQFHPKRIFIHSPIRFVSSSPSPTKPSPSSPSPHSPSLSSRSSVLGDGLREKVQDYLETHSGLFDGSRKRELSLWWLNLIETAVEQHLVTYWSYSLNAVPFNYLDEPPASLNLVATNLDTVKNLLMPGPHEQFILEKHLLTPIRNQVYEQIHVLQGELRDAIEFVCRVSGMDSKSSKMVSLNWKSLSLTSIDPSLQGPLKELLEDLDYLDRMDELEVECQKQILKHSNSLLHPVANPPSTTPQSPSSSASSTDPSQTPNSPSSPFLFDRSMDHIVPVTGLIFNKLQRLSNELATVLEHWSRY